MTENSGLNDAARPWPTEIRLAKDKRTLTVVFDNGERFDLSAELLRVLSPSAEVQGHSPDQKQTVPGKRRVEIMQIEPVGNYAIRLTFDDMHDTGLYSWDYLIELGRDGAERFADYERELAEKGLSREPKAP